MEETLAEIHEAHGEEGGEHYKVDIVKTVFSSKSPVQNKREKIQITLSHEGKRMHDFIFDESSVLNVRSYVITTYIK